MRIPVQNIYYLLLYAWNKLEEAGIASVEGLEETELVDLFGRVLSGGVAHLLQRGLDRGYIEYSEATRRPRGKIEISPTIQQCLPARGELQCTFDELSHDVLHNQIIKGGITILLAVEDLNKDLRYELAGLRRRLGGVADIRLSRGLFRRIQLHRNISFYDFLLRVCELLIENLFPDEATGQYRFRDFTRDETAMAAVFEAFIRNFYAREHPTHRVHRRAIRWAGGGVRGTADSWLPMMVTDICLEGDNETIVVETKYSWKTLQEHRGHMTVHSPHLFQLFAYLENLQVLAPGRLLSGLLLYPTVDIELDLHFELHGHHVAVRTVNLKQPWRQIHDDLLATIDSARGALLEGLGA